MAVKDSQQIKLRYTADFLNGKHPSFIIITQNVELAQKRVDHALLLRAPKMARMPSSSSCFSHSVLIFECFLAIGWRKRIKLVEEPIWIIVKEFIPSSECLI
ncbi:hypothetical protein BCCGELA001_30115 [Bradyrhizobium sp. CCGE-LA001]|nr:hypothetical protein BCCGELA001_30115 [Bradyrhizobium sp. CCGE-LA001]